MLADDTLDIVCRYRQILAEVVVPKLPTAQRFPLSEIIGAALGCFEASQPAGLEDSPHTRQLAVVDQTDTDLVQLIPDHSRGIGGGLRLRLSVDDEHTELGRGVIVRAYRRGEFPLAHRAVKPRRAPRAEQRSGHVERRRVLVQCARGAPTEEQLALRDVARQLTVSEAGVVGLLRSRSALRLAGLQRTVLLVDAAQRHLRIDVT